MTSDAPHERARFTALKDVTADDMRLIVRGAEVPGAGLADRVLAHLALHDIGDTLGACNPPEIGAAFAPRVRRVLEKPRSSTYPAPPAE